MSKKEPEGALGTNRFDIYLHFNEEMKAIKDVTREEYSYEQLISDAYELALSQCLTCSRESVFVSHERMVRGRRCKSPLSCDYGLKNMFSSNQTAYVFFVKCYDGLPGLGLIAKVKRSNKMAAEEGVHSFDSDEELIKQASTSMVENVPLASISEVAEEKMMVSSNQLDGRSNHVSVSHEIVRKRESVKQVCVRKRKMASSSQLAMLHRQDMVARVNVPLASISEDAEERMMVSSNQLDDRSNHVSVSNVYVRKRKPLKQVYVRKRKMVSSSQPAMLHRQDMVARVNVPLASISEVAEERMMISSNQLDDRSNHVPVSNVYVRKRKPLKQVV